MNKLMGFYELKAMSLPSIPWKEYTGKEILDDNFLWTIRSAVFKGNDLNLPRKVGVSACETKDFADKLTEILRGNGIVIYYPYFIANKSGTLEVRKDSIVIEAVKDDLWNLVTFSRRDVTYQIFEDNETSNGNNEFLI